MNAYPNLGSLIREKRTQTGFTQNDLAKVIGWRTIDRISDIEAGRVTPDRDILQKVLGVLRLTPEERGLALLLSGLPPTDTEIEEILDLVRREIDDWPGPAYVMDYTWRLIYPNDKALAHFALNRNHPVVKGRENLLKLTVDQTSHLYRGAIDNKRWRDFVRIQVALFKEEHLARTNEPWFVELLRELMMYPEFARLWYELDEATVMRFSRMRALRGVNILRIPPWNKKKAASRGDYIFSSPVTLDQRFRARLFVEGRAQLTETDRLSASEEVRTPARAS